ncbi:MAG: NO-inducible flavohemoprotein, partial [Thauera sp.]|nr:NO-inducible flavohemoprotein [Thauera sp.]
MDARVRELVKATIPVLKEHGVALTTYFYQRMFRHNPELKNIFNQSHNETGKQPVALAMAVLAYAENIDDPSVLAPVITLIANKHASVGIRAEHYPIVGKHLLASIREVLGDAASDELINAWGVAYGALADVFIDAESKLYNQACNADGGWSGWRSFRIIDKVRESEEITSLHLVPCDGGPLPAYRAGQYTTARVFVPELGVMQLRQYTLSIAPGAMHFRISVKREPAGATTPAGRVSNRLHDFYKVGDMLELAPPFGEFFLDETLDGPVVLISGGVGITPMISMLDRLVAAAPSRPVQFVHACRNAAVFAFGAHLAKVAERNPQVRLHLFHDEGAVSAPVQAGRV